MKIITQLKAWHWIVLTSLCFVTILGVTVFHVECSIKNGTQVFLETIPVDPRDILRGDYVNLRFKIAEDAHDIIEKAQEGLKPGWTSAGDIYITYTLSEENYALFDEVIFVHQIESTPEKPFLKARYNGWNRVTLNAERFFVPEGKGLTIEDMEDVSLKVAISTSGKVFPQDLYQNGEKIDLKLIESQEHNFFW